MYPLYKHRHRSPKGPTRQDLIDILYIFHIDHYVFYHPVITDACCSECHTRIYLCIHLRTVTGIRRLLTRNIMSCVYENRNSRLEKNYFDNEKKNALCYYDVGEFCSEWNRKVAFLNFVSMLMNILGLLVSLVHVHTQYVWCYTYYIV